MAIRRIASYLGATAGAFALALAPSVANAATFNHIELGGVAVPAAGKAFTANNTGKTAPTAVVPGFGTITCSTASAAGSLLPTTLKITAFSITCPTIFPGTTVAIGVNSSGSKCVPGIVLTPTAGQTVTKIGSATNPPGYAAPYDTAVTGAANFGSGATTNDKCVLVTFKLGSLTICSFKLHGLVPTTFNETPKGTKPVISQTLNLHGGLTISELTGTCTGLANGAVVDLDVTLNPTTPIVSPATNPGLIDFAP